MIIIYFAPLAASVGEPLPTPEDEVVVTASRLPEEGDEVAASASRFDQEQIERLGSALVEDLVRLTPSASVNTNGPAGSFTQVRLRGAEANHTLLFVDGIKVNDLAFADEPRFELLNADLASSLEVVRGPQSALWGSQAIGGVVAVNPRLGGKDGYRAMLEAGSFGTRRASVGLTSSPGKLDLGLGLGWQRADGIDVTQGGDKDGYENLSGRAFLSAPISPSLSIGANGFVMDGRSDYDGSDPYTFADTHDLETESRLAAGRVWLEREGGSNGLGARLSASLLDADNRNIFDGSEFNRAEGQRTTLSAQFDHRLTLGQSRHRLLIAGDVEDERYQADDVAYGGATAQDTDRRHRALTAQWSTEIGRLNSDISLRHDIYSDFANATTLRASLLARLGSGLSLVGSYGEGFAPPTFTELYGFFPGSFVGNPDLKPESSKGGEISLRYASQRFDMAATAFRQRLSDEIVTVFNPDFTSSAANRIDKSQRDGIELEVRFHASDRINLSANYSYLDASEPGVTGQLKEIRRPKHSGAIALDGRAERVTYGASLALTGERPDNDFSVFPARAVTLDNYWLASARVEYALTDRLGLYVRSTNLLDSEYQDSFGYRTEGRGLFVGIRLADPRSSR